MTSWRDHPLRLLAATVFILALIWLLAIRQREKLPGTVQTAATPSPAKAVASAVSVTSTPTVTSDRTGETLTHELQLGLERLLNRRDAREREALLAFKDEASYRDFLARAQSVGL